MLREVTVKISLERIDMQKEVTIEALLDSGAIGSGFIIHYSRKHYKPIVVTKS